MHCGDSAFGSVVSIPEEIAGDLALNSFRTEVPRAKVPASGRVNPQQLHGRAIVFQIARPAFTQPVILTQSNLRHP